MDWQRLKTFFWVAKAGSFRQASDDLDISAAALSRQIALLEAELRVKLFIRHARGLRLTEMGETLFQSARSIYSETKRAEALLDSNRGEPQGVLKVTTPVSSGEACLAPRVAEFIERFPGIRIELLLSDADLDMSMREADVAIRFESREHPDLVRKRLATIRFYAWATPAYLRKFGIPKRSDDFDDHRLIAYIRPDPADEHAYNWPLWAGRRNKNPRQTYLRTNNLNSAFQAASSGLGIAVLPEYYAWDNPELVQVLPKLNVYRRDLSFLYAPELRSLRRLSSFREFMIEKFRP